jgi:hypothetical protein
MDKWHEAKQRIKFVPQPNDLSFINNLNQARLIHIGSNTHSYDAYDTNSSQRSCARARHAREISPTIESRFVDASDEVEASGSRHSYSYLPRDKRYLPHWLRPASHAHSLEADLCLVDIKAPLGMFLLIWIRIGLD